MPPVQLTPDECRVLGTLVEKAQTTPAQYPITLNALTAGCNQRNNRDPVTDLSEEQVLDALDSLRRRGLVRDVMLSGSRVTKYRHLAREVIGVDTAQLVILAELLLRGPQTSGELRARASRMHPIESLQAVEATLSSLIDRPERADGDGADGTGGGPLVRRLAPAPGTRAPRYAQLLCPDLHPLEAAHATGDAPPMRAGADPSLDALAARVEALEAEVAALRDALAQQSHRSPSGA
jgi:uncharacterized protein YceH (UPF0502 family)